MKTKLKVIAKRAHIWSIAQKSKKNESDLSFSV